MDKKAYWLWLQEALGAGAVTDEITAVFPSPEEMYSRGEIEWRLSGVLTNRQIEKLKQCSPEKAQGIVDVCYNNGWTVLTPDDEDYPPKLRSLRNMPLALFVRGDIKRVTQRVCIAVVGTRKASFQGSYLAHRYAAALAYSGICVVSGAAMGIDSCAHNGALDSGGVTAAVLGCGFGYKYLMENEYLRDCVAQSGALITEFPPGFPSSARTFPIRNRIISGLCDATIVIEAGVKSGSLITANCAIEQGRDVFAPPGDVFQLVLRRGKSADKRRRKTAFVNLRSDNGILRALSRQDKAGGYGKGARISERQARADAGAGKGRAEDR